MKISIFPFVFWGWDRGNDFSLGYNLMGSVDLKSCPHCLVVRWIVFLMSISFPKYGVDELNLALIFVNIFSFVTLNFSLPSRRVGLDVKVLSSEALRFPSICGVCISFWLFWSEEAYPLLLKSQNLACQLKSQNFFFFATKKFFTNIGQVCIFLYISGTS